ncbi:MAG: DUF2341 domain-containing protein, partial [Candidatus Thermoplasmatota archaeon]|nr:DUF2341 domain-containing protein [Candidatus Thermoplasmatota archaeon]
MKKKMMVLAVGITILVLLGSIQTTFLYTTQYLTTKPAYDFEVGEPMGWWDCNWSYCKMITIDKDMVAAEQSNFPVLLYESADADLAASAQEDGGDIVFVDEWNLTQYAHELEYFNGDTGKLVAWVNVTTLYTYKDTILYMYYGNPDCVDQEDVVGTWNDDYMMVQHLSESSGTHYDSTSNGNNGTVGGTVTQGSSGGLAQMDGSDHFSDGTGYINFGNQSSLTPTSITVEGWVQDPPVSLLSQRVSEVQICDKHDEQVRLVPGQRFSVSRTLSGAGEMVFAVLYSPGVVLQDITLKGVSVFAGSYTSGSPHTTQEHLVEQHRSILPQTLQELPLVGYTSPIPIHGEAVALDLQLLTTEAYSGPMAGRISYLVFDDSSLDYEATTHWSLLLWRAWDSFSSLFHLGSRFLNTEEPSAFELPADITDAIAAGETVRVVLSFDEDCDFEQQVASLRAAGFQPTAALSSEKMVAGDLDAAVYETMKTHTGIIDVTEDEPFSVLLNESLSLIGFSETFERFGYTGEGVTICILDTGVDPAVVPYAYGYDFVNDDPDAFDDYHQNSPFDENGHGTAVASVIHRIAPNATLIVAKVLDEYGQGYASDVLEGLQYCIAQQPDIIHFSIGSTAGCDGFCDEDPVTQLCIEAVEQGVFVVAAAGNSGSTSLVSPACGSLVCSVGATNDADGIASFSNVHPTLDLFAPGVDITTPLGTRSGTSMSAPFVTGGAALVLEQQALSPEQLRYRLRSTGVPIHYVYNESLALDIARVDLFTAVANRKTMEPFDYSWWGQGRLPEQQPVYTTLGTVSYYFNSYNTKEAWSGSPENMVGGEEENFASTTSDRDVELCTGNTYPGGGSGSITTVELRVYSYSESDGEPGQIIIRPVFGGSTDGDNYFIEAPLVEPAWSAYQDITNDESGPISGGGWEWADITALDCDIEASFGAETAVYCAKVEVRVTYEVPSNPPEQSNPVPGNGSSCIDTPPSYFNVTVSDEDSDEVTVALWTNASGSWVKFNETTGSVGTISFTNTSWVTATSTKYWWSANVSDDTDLWSNATYYFYTTGPFQSSPVPSNGSSDVSLSPSWFNITVTDCNAMDIYLRTNASGTWVTFNSTEEETNGTFSFTNTSWVSLYNHTYYWSVNVTGSPWENETYHFTSQLIDPPADLKAYTYNTTQINLTWTKESDADTTLVEWNSTETWKRGEGTQIYNGSAESYDHTSLSAHTLYYYQAWSYNATENLWSTTYVYSFAKPNNSIPVPISRISPDPAYSTDTLHGWVNGTDADGDNLIYYYRWYKDGELNYTGSIGAYDITKVDNIDDGGTAYGITGNGSYLYLANYDDGLRAYTFNGSDLTNEGHIDNGGTAYNVWCDGTYIYLANDNDGLRAYTFDGASFSNVGSVDTGGSPRDVWGDGTYIYVVNYRAALIAYTFDGSSFTYVSEVLEDDDALSVWGDGTYLYLAATSGGVRAYTFDGTSFTNVGSVDGGGNEQFIWGDGTYLYVTSYTSGLYVYSFDGSSFTNLSFLPMSINWGVWGDGTYLYVADNTVFYILTFDGSTFTTVESNGTGTAPPPMPYHLWGNDTYLYVTFGNTGLYAFNTSFGYTQATEMNVHNISSAYTEEGQTWTFSVRAHDGQANATDWVNSSVTIQSSPTQTGETPSNGTSAYSLPPTLNITVDDADDDTVTGYWYSNSSGSWVLFNTNTSIDTSSGAVDISFSNSNFSEFGETYWWSLNLTDGVLWTNATYHFFTRYNTELSVSAPTLDYVNHYITFSAYYNFSDEDSIISNTITRIGDLGAVSSVVAVDLDGDGLRNDVAIGEQGDVFAYWQNGTQAWNNIAPVNYVFEVEVGNPNGGADEIYALDYSGTLWIINATGETWYTSGDTGENYRCIEVGDLDNNSVGGDVVIAGALGGSDHGMKAYIFNSGSNTWVNTWNATEATDYIVEMDIQEYDDRPTLVATADGATGRGRVYWGSNGTVKSLTEADKGTFYSVEFADLDNDGCTDELLYGEAGELYAYSEAGSQLWYADEPLSAIYDIEVADVDGDGYVDDAIVADNYMIIWAIDNTGELIWSFEEPQEVNEHYEPGYVYNIVVGDVDGDGEDDIIMGGLSNTIWILALDGTVKGRYFPGYDSDVANSGMDYIGYSFGSNPGITVLDDVNSDGINDYAFSSTLGYVYVCQQVLALINFSDTATAKYMSYNYTAGAFQYKRIFNESDFDMSQWESHNYAWYVNCTKTAYMSQNSNNATIQIYNRNSSLDATADSPVETGSNVTFSAQYTNESTPITAFGFEEVWLKDVGENAFSCAFADLDHDGVRDEAVILDSGTLWAYDIDGTELWTATEPALYGFEIDVGDLTGNGYDDNVVIANYDNQIRVFNDTGGQVWASGDLGGDVYSIEVGDVDKDGDKDDFVAGLVVGSNYNVSAYTTDDGESWSLLWSVSGAANYLTTVLEVHISDLDETYDHNLVTYTTYTYGRQVVRNSSDGSLIFQGGSDLGSIFCCCFADLNGDGNANESVFGETGDLYMYDEAGTLLATGNSESTTYEVMPVNLDDDANDELVITDYYYVRAFDHEGTQLWVWGGSEPSMYYGYSMNAADVNNDGEIEIIVANGNDIIYVFNASGTLLRKYEAKGPEDYPVLTGIGSTFGSQAALAISDETSNNTRYILVVSGDTESRLLEAYPQVWLSVESDSYRMDYNSTSEQYEYTKEFSIGGSYEWNVTCSSEDYVSQVSENQTLVATSFPTQSNPVPANETLCLDFPVSCLNITCNDTDAENMNVTILTNESGSWVVLNQTTVGFTNSTQSFTNTSCFDSYGTKYWWSVNLTDGYAWTNRTYWFTTKDAPTVWLRSPANESTDVSRQPTVWLQINTTCGYTTSVYFNENTTDSWVLRQTNSSVGSNTSVNWTFSEASEYNTTYWYTVNVSGSPNVTQVYHFTTEMPITVQTNASTGVEETNATLHGYLQHDGGESCTVRFEYGTTTAYGTNTSNQTATTETIPDLQMLLAAGAETSEVQGLSTLDLSTSTTSTFDYQGTVYALTYDDTYIYVGGSTTKKVFQYWRSNFTKRAESAEYGDIKALTSDGTYVYAGGELWKPIYQYWASNMTKRGETNSDLFGYYAFACDETYVYAGGTGMSTAVYQYWASNLTVKAQTDNYGGTVYGLVYDGTYVYAAGATTQKVFQYWAS